MKRTTPTSPHGGAPDVETTAAPSTKRRLRAGQADTQPDLRAILLADRTRPDLHAIAVPRLPAWALRGAPEQASALDRLARLGTGVVHPLEELVRALIASANYLLAAAHAAETPALSILLEASAEQRRVQGSVLRSIIALNDNSMAAAPDEVGISVTRPHHDDLSHFGEGDTRLVGLVVRQEHAVLRVFDEVLGAVGGSPVADTVAAQAIATREHMRSLEALLRVAR